MAKDEQNPYKSRHGKKQTEWVRVTLLLCALREEYVFPLGYAAEEQKYVGYKRETIESVIEYLKDRKRELS